MIATLFYQGTKVGNGRTALALARLLRTSSVVEFFRTADEKMNGDSGA
jgi:hypothetical protein